MASKNINVTAVELEKQNVELKIRNVQFAELVKELNEDLVQTEQDLQNCKETVLSHEAEFEVLQGKYDVLHVKYLKLLRKLKLYNLSITG